MKTVWPIKWRPLIHGLFLFTILALCIRSYLSHDYLELSWRRYIRGQFNPSEVLEETWALEVAWSDGNFQFNYGHGNVTGQPEGKPETSFHVNHFPYGQQNETFSYGNQITNPPWLGFQFSRLSNWSNDSSERWEQGYGQLSIGFPAWFVIVVSMILPLMNIGRKQGKRDRRAQMGLCIYCGYNLSGNTSGVCPECGGELTQIVPGNRETSTRA